MEKSSSDAPGGDPERSGDIWGGGPPEAAGIEVRTVEPGSRFKLADGSIVEVTANPGDGYWIVARYLSSPAGASQAGKEEPVFYQDIVGRAD